MVAQASDPASGRNTGAQLLRDLRPSGARQCEAKTPARAYRVA